MKLYMFEHCSLCFRVRMIAALKRLHLQENIVLDDDTDTMVRTLLDGYIAERWNDRGRW